MDACRCLDVQSDLITFCWCYSYWRVFFSMITLGKKIFFSFFFFPPKLWFSWKNSVCLLFSSESAALCPGSPVRGRRVAVVVTPKPGGGKAPGFSWGDQGNSQGPIPDIPPSGLGWAASAGVALELADLPLPAGLPVCGCPAQPSCPSSCPKLPGEAVILVLHFDLSVNHLCGKSRGQSSRCGSASGAPPPGPHAGHSAPF